MNPTNASQPSSRTSSTPAAPGSLRPRTRRLISGLDGDEEGIEFNSAPGTRIASPRGSPPASRARSPIPNRHPSRTSVREIPRSNPSGKSSFGSGSAGALSGLWGGSWSGLQGLASSLLGSDTTSSSRAPSRDRRRPLGASPSRNRTNGPPQEWGPPIIEHTEIGAGSRGERETLVRAAKRKDLLRANGHSMPDSTGRYKRRNSDEFSTGSVQPSEQDDRDALVYLHHVRPQDTLMGITIKYNCQPAVLRKANRMWPNDPIQSRKIILLPVDACGVKGRPVPGPQQPPAEEEDLLVYESMSMHESPSTASAPFPNGLHKQDPPVVTLPSPEQRPLSSAESAGESTITDTEPPWKHDSWVLLSNEKEPTEIARLPRRHLGYFPRARRKSNPFSDFGTPRLTPTTSLDISRIPPSPGSAQSEAYAALRPSLSRHRSSSNAAFPASSFLHGPGGVGTLGKSVRIIGPGDDRLNKLLGPHLPNVAPPPTQTVFTPWNPGLELDDDLISFGAEGVPASSMSRSGNGMDLQEMSGAVERWVRKTAKRAVSALETSSVAATTKGNAGVQGMSAGSGIGDLIELTDAFEIGDGEGESPGGVEVGHSLGGSSSAMIGGTLADGVRGRKLAREEVGGKSGKGD